MSTKFAKWPDPPNRAPVSPPLSLKGVEVTEGCTEEEEEEKGTVLANTVQPDTAIDTGAPVFFDIEKPTEYEKRLEGLRLKRLGVRTEEKKMLREQ